MAKVKVRVLNAVVDGKGAGSELSIDERSVSVLVSNGYIELVNGEEKTKVEDKADVVKEESAPQTKSTPKKSSNSRKK